MHISLWIVLYFYVLTQLFGCAKGYKVQRDKPELNQVKKVRIYSQDNAEKKAAQKNQFYLSSYLKKINDPVITLGFNDNLQGSQVIDHKAQFIKYPSAVSRHSAKHFSSGVRLGNYVSFNELYEGDLYYLVKNNRDVKYRLSFKILKVEPKLFVDLEYTILSFQYL